MLVSEHNDVLSSEVTPNADMDISDNSDLTDNNTSCSQIQSEMALSCETDG